MGLAVHEDAGWHYLSTKRITAAVHANSDGRVDEAAPIFRRFLGQPLSNLKRWLAGHPGGVRHSRITDKDF